MTIVIIAALMVVYDFFMVRPARRVTHAVYRDMYRYFKRKL